MKQLPHFAEQYLDDDATLVSLGMSLGTKEIESAIAELNTVLPLLYDEAHVRDYDIVVDTTSQATLLRTLRMSIEDIASRLAIDDLPSGVRDRPKIEFVLLVPERDALLIHAISHENPDRNLVLNDTGFYRPNEIVVLWNSQPSEVALLFLTTVGHHNDIAYPLSSPLVCSLSSTDGEISASVRRYAKVVTFSLTRISKSFETYQQSE